MLRSMMFGLATKKGDALLAGNVGPFPALPWVLNDAVLLQHVARDAHLLAQCIAKDIGFSPLV